MKTKKVKTVKVKISEIYDLFRDIFIESDQDSVDFYLFVDQDGKLWREKQFGYSIPSSSYNGGWPKLIYHIKGNGQCYLHKDKYRDYVDDEGNEIDESVEQGFNELIEEIEKKYPELTLV